MKQLDPKAVWIFFIKGMYIPIVPIIIFLFYIINGIYSYVGNMDSGEEFPVASTAFSMILLFFVVILIILVFIWAKLSYRFYRYELTDAGFRKELGVIYKKYVTIPYDRIQNVDIYRGILARILGLSDLNIQTAGASAVSGRYIVRGIGAEGRLPGLSKEIAEQLRDELIQRSRQSRGTGQGL